MPNNEAGPTRETMPQLFVGGLSSSTTSKDLFNYFKLFGHVLSCEVQRAESGKSKRFGFVIFYDVHVAEWVIGTPDHSIMNKRVTIEWALDPVAKQMSQETRAFRKVYVGNIPSWTRKEQIEVAISMFGKIEKVTRLRKKDDGSMYCYAIMQEISSAQRLLKQQFINSSDSLQLIIKPFTPQKRKEESNRDQKFSNDESHARWQTFLGPNNLNDYTQLSGLHGNQVSTIDRLSGQTLALSSRFEGSWESRVKNSQLLSDNILECSPKKIKVSIRAGLELQLVDYSCPIKFNMPLSTVVSGPNQLNYVQQSRFVPGHDIRFNISTNTKAKLPGKMF